MDFFTPRIWHSNISFLYAHVSSDSELHNFRNGRLKLFKFYSCNGAVCMHHMCTRFGPKSAKSTKSYFFLFAEGTYIVVTYSIFSITNLGLFMQAMISHVGHVHMQITAPASQRSGSTPDSVIFVIINVLL
jgi:hypothetical protein